MSDRHFPFVVLEIEADDLQRAVSFYSAIFGWSFTDSVVERGALDADLGGDHDTTVRVHLRARHPPPGPAAHRHGHSLCVHELAPVMAGVVAAGGRLIAGPVDVPGLGRRLYVRDTEGNEVAILEPSHESHYAGTPHEQRSWSEAGLLQPNAAFHDATADLPGFRPLMGKMAPRRKQP